jgi:hypothetical protein
MLERNFGNPPSKERMGARRGKTPRPDQIEREHLMKKIDRRLFLAPALAAAAATPLLLFAQKPVPPPENP